MLNSDRVISYLWFSISFKSEAELSWSRSSSSSNKKSQLLFWSELASAFHSFLVDYFAYPRQFYRILASIASRITFFQRVPLHKGSVQGVISLSGHFACLCQGFDFYELKKILLFFCCKKEKGNTFTLLFIFIVKSLQKEQNSTNLLQRPPICWYKLAITPKWINY